MARQAQLAEALGDSAPASADVQPCKSRLSALLESRRCLIILDDVWHLKHVMAFAVLGEYGSFFKRTQRETTCDKILVSNALYKILKADRSPT
jgi:hypothetical protein